MTYEELVGNLVRGIEAFGASVMVVGGALASIRYLRAVAARDPHAYRALRESLGHVILLGLEILIVADIVRTIVVDQTLESVAVLGGIVVIRIVLSFSLEVEIDGAWPWRRGPSQG